MGLYLGGLISRIIYSFENRWAYIRGGLKPGGGLKSGILRYCNCRAGDLLARRSAMRPRGYRDSSLYSSSRLSSLDNSVSRELAQYLSDYAVFTSGLNRRFYGLNGDMFSAVSIPATKILSFNS